MTGMREVSMPELTDEQRRVHRAGEALHRDGASPAGALDLLAAIVEDRTWERMCDAKGVSFAGRFRDFVEARKPFGLGFDPDQLPKVLGLRHPHEAVPKVAYRIAAMRDQVKTLLLSEIPIASSRGGDRRSDYLQNSATVLKRETADHILSRLKSSAPEMAARVISGELTANAAAHQLGWRRPRIVVSSPERVAEALRRTMDPDDIKRLAAILGGDE
ncbi:hypothetical protein FHR83_006795 [Actinoplanes campanulatus]|uniref:Uncharacterized protein n=1 Tax=Actinoplanes campanulatus TaxID=113559 RepID=A0A7W5ANL4_9ACTN|nr:hypothetical protein [Actinoplanes campanulatus]MBB3099089.1 hypothetical protein [Actinoplanes campanulatus]GGN39097.1 hypothetical protein GCM10010109_66640 [Actinoplanes campanulatus]GID40245.1 hypothetical protein Aca09nite_67510 [Actinoplanes campanulatus]